MAELNERGFEQYGGFETTHGHMIRVYESSAASGPHVWLNVRLAEEHRGVRPEGATAHLDLLQAMELRGMLEEFIEGVPERWGDSKLHHYWASKQWREKYPELVLKAARRSCQCCCFGNHDFPCVCDGQDCCHPDRHAPGKEVAKVPSMPEPVCSFCHHSFCHHSEERHTTDQPGARHDYCIECSADDGDHSFNEGPESPQEDFLDRLRAIVPPHVPQERVRDVARLLADLWEIPYERDKQPPHPLWTKALEAAGPGAPQHRVAELAADLMRQEWFDGKPEASQDPSAGGEGDR